MTAALLAFVLGPVRVQRGGAAVELGGARQRAVLARLLAARGAVVTADRLIEDVWGPEPPPGVLSSLHASVSRLRRALEPDRGKGDVPVLQRRGGGYSLAVPTDAERLDQAVARAGDDYLADDSPAIVAALRAALDGWQGEPYAELGEQSWLVGERKRCHELRLVALERLASAHLTAGEPVEASLALWSAFETDPSRERMAALLAVALFRQNRQAGALAVCRRARQVLAGDHGLDPAVELRQVEVAILGQDEDLMPSTIPAIPAIPAVAPVQQRAGGVPGDAGLGSAAGGRLAPAADPNVLVGREHELAVIGAAMSRVVSGQPRIIVLTGEAGIGKTSLAQATAGDRSEQGWIVCWGRCSGSGGAPALWPWLQVLQGLAAVRRLPVSLRSLVDGESVTPADVQAARWRQQRDVAEYLHEVSRSAPLLVIVDDLQWADAASQQMLCGLAESLAGSPVALLVTSRSDAGAESVMVLARLARAGSVRLAMEGLRASDVERLSRGAGLDTDAAALTERTGGNPFLLRETLALAVSIGRSPLDVVAATVEDVLRARVALLPASTGALLSVASVLGRSVDVRVLARVEGAEIGQVETELDEAAGAGLLVPAGSGRMRFVHDLVRETLYHGLSPLRRARLHARALEALEAAGRSGPAELAAHAVAAGPDAALAAVRYAISAAGEAQSRSAYASAVRWWRAAVDAEAIRSREPSGRVELLLELVRAQLDAGDAVSALETRSAAIHAADATGDRTLTARTLVAMDRPMVWLLRPHDSVELSLVQRLEEALRSPPDDEGLVVRLRATLALELYDGTEDPRCDRLSAVAAEGARRIGNPMLLAFALNARQLAMAHPGREAERAELADDLVQLGITDALPTVELLGHQLAEQARGQLGQLENADRHAAQARRLASELSLLLPSLQQRLWDSSRHALDGDFETAFHLLNEVEQMPWQWWARDAMLATVRLTLLLRAGRSWDVAPLLPAAALVHARLAVDAEVLMRAEAGDRLGAVRMFESMPIDLPRDWTWLAAACVQAAAAAACGSREAIDASYTRLEPWAGRIAASGSIDAGPVDNYLDRLRAAAAGLPGQ